MTTYNTTSLVVRLVIGAALLLLLLWGGGGKTLEKDAARPQPRTASAERVVR